MTRPDKETPLNAQTVGLYAAFLLVVALVIQFLWHALQKYGHIEIGTYGIFWSRRVWLWIHLAGGAVGMLLGPIQFLSRLRANYPRFHRWTGRMYLLAMLVAGVGVTGLISTTPAGVGIRVAFVATVLAWLFAALMGFAAIRRRRLPAHRRWMIRAYIMTLSPIVFRALTSIPGVMDITTPAVMIASLLWLSLLAPLLAYELAVITSRMVGQTRRVSLAY